jgi:hypothetical protein
MYPGRHENTDVETWEGGLNGLHIRWSLIVFCMETVTITLRRYITWPVKLGTLIYHKLAESLTDETLLLMLEKSQVGC